MGRSCQGLMLCSWVWLVCSLQLAAAYMDGYGESPGTVKWLKTSDLLKPLRDVRDRDNADNFTRTFAFDEREGEPKSDGVSALVPNMLLSSAEQSRACSAGHRLLRHEVLRAHMLSSYTAPANISDEPMWLLVQAIGPCWRQCMWRTALPSSWC